MPREFMGTVVFVIYAIRPVEDPHEVFFHLMEAIVVTLQYSRGRPPVCTLSSLSAISSIPYLCATAKTLRLSVCEDSGASTSSAYCRPRYEYIYAVVSTVTKSAATPAGR